METVNVNLNARSVDLPYSGSVTFDGTLKYVSTPIFVADGEYPEQLYLSVVNIEGREMVYIKLYVHEVGADHYTVSTYGYVDYMDDVIYRPLFVAPEGIEQIDSFYIEFWDRDDTAESFDYLIYIN